MLGGWLGEMLCCRGWGGGLLRAPVLCTALC